MTEPYCPYCNQPAALVTGATIYPHRPDLAGLNFWLCDPCDAYVGCHKRNPRHGLHGDEPLGRLADAELRQLKSAAHRAFDPLWRDGHFRSRTKAYNWLARQLNMEVKNCHIGKFDPDTCRRVIEISDREYLHG